MQIPVSIVNWPVAISKWHGVARFKLHYMSRSGASSRSKALILAIKAGFKRGFPIIIAGILAQAERKDQRREEFHSVSEDLVSPKLVFFLLSCSSCCFFLLKIFRALAGSFSFLVAALGFFSL